jgi:hypothetical protein
LEDEEKKKANLPASVARLAENLATAVAGSGPGGGGASFMRIDDRNGAVTVGPNRDPFPLTHRMKVDVGNICHGYMVFGEGGGAQRYLVPMVDDPVRPVPPGGYVQKFGDAGAKNATEITLEDLDEPGQRYVFTALGKSNDNRVRNLAAEIARHVGTEQGQRGYVHPVIYVTTGHYFHSGHGREIFHFDYTIIGWSNGEETDGGPTRVSGPAAPWEPTGAAA